MLNFIALFPKLQDLEIENLLCEDLGLSPGDSGTTKSPIDLQLWEIKRRSTASMPPLSGRLTLKRGTGEMFVEHMIAIYEGKLPFRDLYLTDVKPADLHLVVGACAETLETLHLSLVNEGCEDLF
jgi:hypothetical protein